MIRLADLGTLVEREREPDSISRDDGVPSISFQVFKQQDANIVETGEAIKDAAAELRKTLPPGVELRLVYADSDWVARSLSGVKKTLIEGALLTVAIVFLFLHSWRSTIITGLTLPIAVISAFIAVYLFGFTLNFMTMMALSLCIGLLIDDAIVVRENIVRHVHLGKSHRTASLEGTDEIGLAVMATTFAICAVFVPVAFMKGIIGKFFFPFGVTVAVAVLVSLFVSFTLDPMLSSIWKDPPTNKLLRLPVLGHLMRGTDRLLEILHGIYERLIRWIFSSRRYRLFVPPIPAFGRSFDAEGRRDASSPRRLRFATITPRPIVLLIGLASFVVAIAIAPLVGTEFIPDSDNSYIQLNVGLPVGTSLLRGSEKLEQVEALVRKLPEVRMVSTTIGDTGNGSRNSASLSIQLTKPHERKHSQREVEKAIRESLKPIPGIEVTLGNQPIFVSLLGPDPAVLEAETLKFAEKVSHIRGIADLTTSVKPGIPAYAVRLKADAVRELGLTTTQLATSLRAYVNGDVATYWTSPDGEQVDVEIRLPQASRENVAQLDDLPVAYAKDGTPISLVARRRRRAGRQPGGDQAPGPAAAPGDLCRHRRAAERRRRRRRAEDRQGDAAAARLPLRPGRPDARPAGGLRRRPVRARRGGDLHLHRAGLAVLELPAAAGDHGLAAAGADRRDAGAAGHALDAEPVLDDRPGHADGPGDQERDPAGRLRQPRPARWPLGARGAAAGRPGAHAADHHDHRGDDLRHAAAGAGARRRRRDPGADGARDHRRRDHLDAADAGRRAGALQLPGARQAGGETGAGRGAASGAGRRHAGAHAGVEGLSFGAPRVGGAYCETWMTLRTTG